MTSSTDEETGWGRFFEDPDLVVPDDFDTGEDPPPEEREIF